jgi:hypothetical protein
MKTEDLVKAYTERIEEDTQITGDHVHERRLAIIEGYLRTFLNEVLDEAMRC